ncbi:MAG: hypothetical protein RL885_08745 [Planctomycetota bacterium]
MLLPLLLLTTSLATQVPEASLELPELRREDLARWRSHVRPTAKELAFEQIDWIPEFAAGVRESERLGKPMLFWAMNGHPLGCT